MTWHDAHPLRLACAFLALSPGLINPMGRLGGGAGAASSSAIESASSAMLREWTETLRSRAQVLD